MELDKLLIGVVLIAIISVSIGSLMTDLTSRYQTRVDPAFATTFNKFNESYQLAEQITEDVKLGGVGQEADSTDFDVGESVKAGLNVVKTVFVQGLPTLFSSITGLGSFIPLPEYITRGLQAMLLISIAFALVYLYFRYKNA